MQCEATTARPHGHAWTHRESHRCRLSPRRMFDYNKVSIDPRGHDSPVTYLIQNRYLADARFVPISFESDTAITEPHPGMDYSTDDLDDLGCNRERTRQDRRTRGECGEAPSAYHCVLSLSGKRFGMQ